MSGLFSAIFLPSSSRTRRVAMVMGAVGLVVGAGGFARADDPAQGPAKPKAKTPKYYFKVVEVTGDVDDETRRLGGELLAKELASRPEFVGELGEVVAAAPKPEDLAPELRKRGLRGFEISLKFDALERKLQEPRPGSRLKQLAVSARLSIFGAEIPDKKIAFSGQGESMQIVEVVERKLDDETRALVVDVIADAVRQAVDQAVLKLALPRNTPLDERKGKRRARPGPGKSG